jgi:hypothetical protein
MEQHDLLNNDLLITSTSQSYLLTAAKWCKFLAIAGFIFCGLMVIGGIAASALMSTLSTYSIIPFMKYLGFLYIIFAIILFFPCLYLLKFSNKTQNALTAASHENLETAFANLKSFFKFYGVFTIVILVLYALIFLAGISGMFMR